MITSVLSLIYCIVGMIYLAIGAFVVEPVTMVGRWLFTRNKGASVRNPFLQLICIVIWPIVIFYNWTRPEIDMEEQYKRTMKPAKHQHKKTR